MRAGFGNTDEFFEQFDQSQVALDQPIIRTPDSMFQYSNNTSQLFEPLLLRATGMNAHQWLTEKILKPIGIDETAIGLWLDPTGVNPMTYCCIDMRADDFARFGVLFANGGTWDGDMIVSAESIPASRLESAGTACNGG